MQDKELGDAAFREGNYELALTYYHGNQEAVLLNRAAALLELGRYDECIEVCDKLDHPKARYRRAKAKMFLGEYEDLVGTTPASRKLARDIAVRKVEAQGRYDWSSILKEAQTTDRLNRAEFQQHWEVREGRPRGAFAVKDIAQGEVLLVCKAEALTSKDDLVELLEQEIKRNPSKERLYDLYGGQMEDKARKIAKYNSFETENTQFTMSCLPTRRSNYPDAVGLWLLASYFNHSCLYNCTRIFVQDLLVIKAARDIKKDEELTLGYVNKVLPYAERKKTFEAFEFDCTCRLCEEDRRCTGRDWDAAIKAIMALPSLMRMKTEAERVVEKVNKSDERATTYFDLIRPYNALLTILIELQDWHEARKIAQVLRDIGRLPDGNVVDDLELGLTTLLLAIDYKIDPEAGIDLVDLMKAWKVRGLEPDFLGYWNEFGPWWVKFEGEHVRKALERNWKR